jgi:hypothetical protein
MYKIKKEMGNNIMTELKETAFKDHILDGTCSTADPIINISYLFHNLHII